MEFPWNNRSKFIFPVMLIFCFDLHILWFSLGSNPTANIMNITLFDRKLATLTFANVTSFSQRITKRKEFY